MRSIFFLFEVFAFNRFDRFLFPSTASFGIDASISSISDSILFGFFLELPLCGRDLFPSTVSSVGAFGLGAFGPHMHFIGRVRAKRVAKIAAAEAEYRSAPPAQQKATLADYRAERMVAARAKDVRRETKLAGPNAARQARLAHPLGFTYALSVRPQHLATRLKTPTLPIAALSRAFPDKKRERACTVLQARVRGRNARADETKRADAAAKVQAISRGRKMRQFASEEEEPGPVRARRG